MREEFKCIIEMFYSVKLNQVLVAVFYRKLFINFFFFFSVSLYISLSSICSNHSSQLEFITGFFNNHCLPLIYASAFVNRTRMITDFFFFLHKLPICHIGKQSVDCNLVSCVKFGALKKIFQRVS